MESNERTKRNTINQATILAQEWKNLVKFILKRDPEAPIQIVKADFDKLIRLALPKFLHHNQEIKDSKIEFTAHVSFANLGTVLTHLGKSKLFKSMFHHGEISPDGHHILGSQMSWNHENTEFTSTFEDKKITILTRFDFDNNRVIAVINWETIKIILPYLDDHLGIILVNSSLQSINSKN